MLKPIILTQCGDKPLLASDSHIRCFDVRNKIIYCISTSLAHINIMKRSHAALIFKKESTKSKLKSAKLRYIYEYCENLHHNLQTINHDEYITHIVNVKVDMS